MQLRYRFFRGGDRNPFQKEVDGVYDKITEERRNADPDGRKPLREVLPELDSWADYVVALSKSTFWQMERNVRRSRGETADKIEEFYRTAASERRLGDWLREAEADECEKALCYYIASQYYQFNPDDWVVDFRLYFTEGGRAMKGGDSNENSVLEPYMFG